jgi:hypothetical protein
MLLHAAIMGEINFGQKASKEKTKDKLGNFHTNQKILD